MKTVFCIGNGQSRAPVFSLGNGQSRLGVDLKKLKQHGKIYGCNAIYRTNPDDIDDLVGVDQGIKHEKNQKGK